MTSSWMRLIQSARTGRSQLSCSMKRALAMRWPQRRCQWSGAELPRPGAIRMSASEIFMLPTLELGPEDSLEDRVDVLEVVEVVEHRVDVGGAELAGDFVVGLQQFGKLTGTVAVHLPDLHGVALHRGIGGFATEPGLREGEQDALRIVQPAEQV